MKPWFAAAAAAVVLTAALPLFAALGGGAASIQADQVHMQASLRTIAAAGYNVQEMKTAAGAVVREYVSPQGQVFAVAWHGPWPPDMRQLLGNYFDQYVQARRQQSSARIGRRPLVIDEPGLVVESGGHQRSFVGKAYVPAMLPAGVKAEDIQ
jgi:Protein of unknown function (DUF2844)